MILYDIVLLRTFSAVCEAGGFTKAARQVHLTQSAVSLHIKRLEEQIGSQLIRRNAHGIELTQCGEVLLSYARRMLDLSREAEHRLGLDRAHAIRIGIPEYFDLRPLSPLLDRFLTAQPEMRLQIELGFGPDIEALIEAGELELAVVSHEIGEGEGVSLFRERRVWAAGSEMELDLGKPVPLALYPPVCRWRQLALELLDRAGRPWTIVAQSGGIAGILAAVGAGLAITILPEHHLPDSLRSLSAVRSLPPLPDFEFALRRGRKPSAAADRLAERILQLFRFSGAAQPGIGGECQRALQASSGT
jgi:DNA-binding transcriptional LysR family regulator